MYETPFGAANAGVICITPERLPVRAAVRVYDRTWVKLQGSCYLGGLQSTDKRCVAELGVSIVTPAIADTDGGCCPAGVTAAVRLVRSSLCS
jgi:hypothetical protein